MVTLKQVRIFQSHYNRVACLNFNDNILSSGSKDKRIINFDLRNSKKFAFKFIGHKQEVCGIKWNPDGNILASGGNDNKVLLKIKLEFIYYIIFLIIFKRFF
jgi:cell division cycle 20-like protein 1 (cofactor of APC complex)